MQMLCTQLYTKCTFTFVGYIFNMMALLFDEVLPNNQPYLEELQNVPVPDCLASQFEHPPLDEAIAAYVSRFRQGEV